MDLATFERISEPDYLQDLTVRPMGDLRTMRAECKAVETAAAIGHDEFPGAGGNGVVVVEVRDQQKKHVLTVATTISVRVDRIGEP